MALTELELTSISMESLTYMTVDSKQYAIWHGGTNKPVSIIERKYRLSRKNVILFTIGDGVMEAFDCSFETLVTDR
jgi:hypothetical protein